MEKKQPNLEINQFSRVICKTHPLYSGDKLELFRCNTCDLFEQDKCLFSKREIEGLYLKMTNGKYYCELCSRKIKELMNLIYVKFLQRINLLFPLINPDYDSLPSNRSNLSFTASKN